MIAIILGTRPEIIERSPIIDTFFEGVDLSEPKYTLDFSSGAKVDQTNRIIIGIEKTVLEELI